MTNYVALIRGINVGGNNKLPMADLKRELTAIGLEQVQTYIQSGNVVLRSNDDAPAVRGAIEQAIARIANIRTKVLVRTEAELAALIANCPYGDEASAEGKNVHATLLDEPLTEKQRGQLEAGKAESDRFHAAGTTVYCHYGLNVRDSKLAANFAKLGDGATTRNWNTILKLQAMLEDL